MEGILFAIFIFMYKTYGGARGMPVSQSFPRLMLLATGVLIIVGGIILLMAAYDLLVHKEPPSKTRVNLVNTLLVIKIFALGIIIPILVLYNALWVS